MIEIMVADIAKYDMVKILQQVEQGEQVVLSHNGQQYHISANTQKPIIKKPRKAGSAKGQIKIADDFDEPLDCFKEYV